MFSAISQSRPEGGGASLPTHGQLLLLPPCGGEICRAVAPHRFEAAYLPMFGTHSISIVCRVHSVLQYAFFRNLTTSASLPALSLTGGALAEYDSLRDFIGFCPLLLVKGFISCFVAARSRVFLLTLPLLLLMFLVE